MEYNMSIDGDLVWLCREFIRRHKITCSESIYQRDDIIRDAYELIEGICETVGYYEREDDEEE
jgi:hypothetical protein